MVELDDLDICDKRSPTDRILSANSLANEPSPSPMKRLQAFREKLLAYEQDDWRYDLKCPIEIKCPTPKIPSPKLPSPFCSPILHSHRLHHCHPVHFHNYDDYPYEHFHHNHFNGSIIHEESSTQTVDCLNSPPKYAVTPVEQKLDIQSPSGHRGDDNDKHSLKQCKKIRRAKSCPRDLFSTSSKCSDNEKSQNESTELNVRRLGRDELTPSFFIDCQSTPVSRQQQHTYRKTIPKIRAQKVKSKTPNSMDEFLASKLVRNNHAAKLRQKSSRKKINDLEDEKLKATKNVLEFIPKCHHWNVRGTPAWKTFLSEE